MNSQKDGSIRLQGKPVSRYGSLPLSVIALFLILCYQPLNEVGATRIVLREHNSNQNQQTAREAQSVDQKGQEQELGIFDRAVAKIKQKEEQDKAVQEEKLLKIQQNYLKATRQAFLLSSPYSSDLEDVQQVMKNMRMGGTYTPTEQISYDQQIKKIAATQDEYKDEYEGYGSLTEMIKNTDKIADKKAEELTKEQKAQEEEANAKKAEQIAIAKKKMTEALNAAAQKKAEATKNQTATSKPQVASNATKAVQAPAVPVSKPEVAQAQVNATNVAPKSVPSPPSNTVSPPNPAPVIKTQKTISTQNTTSVSSVNKTEVKASNSTSNVTQLSDNVSQVIDEVQDQVQMQNDQPPVQEKKEPVQEEEPSGFIGKYTQKFVKKETEKNTEDSTQLQTSAEDQTTQEIEQKPKKGISARFREQVDRDESDKQQAQEVVNEFQKAMNTQKKSILDRETERLVQEQNDELELEISQSQDQGEVTIDI